MSQWDALELLRTKMMGAGVTRVGMIDVRDIDHVFGSSSLSVTASSPGATFSTQPRRYSPDPSVVNRQTKSTRHN